MATKEFTYQDVAEHNTKKDLYVVIHDKVYDTTKFVDEHPGGEEVLLDVGGQDASEAFEDVGHSDEARETLEKFYVGELKRKPGDPVPKATASAISPPADTSSAGMGTLLYAVLFLGAVTAYFGYNYLQSQQAK
ncbi:cytochrome b5 [Xylariaceae sp. FL0594]|nr:cytochrome b5 [Xylariaceae sp. FL0594]